MRFLRPIERDRSTHGTPRAPGASVVLLPACCWRASLLAEASQERGLAQGGRGAVSMGTMTGEVKGVRMWSEEAGAVALACPESPPQFPRLCHGPMLHQCFNVIFFFSFDSLLAKKHCSKCSPIEQVSLLEARVWNPELFTYPHLPEAPGVGWGPQTF